MGGDSPTGIIRCGRVNQKIKDGRIKTLPRVLHILNLARNLICVKNMDVAVVKTVCGNGCCKMVQGSLELMRGFLYGNLYKLLGSMNSDESNKYVVPKEGGKDNITLIA